jgi:type IV pilus assembly protein PilF
MTMNNWRKKVLLVTLVTAAITGCSHQQTTQHETDRVLPAAVTGAPQTRLQLGMSYLSHGDMAAARLNLQQALDNAPGDFRTQLGMALLEQKSGNKEAAQGYYQQAFHLAPQNGTVLNNYGAFLCSLGQYVPAQQQFSAAVRLPDSGHIADSLENAGYCFLHANQSDEARVLLKRALKVDPDKGSSLLAEANRQFKGGNRTQAQVLLEVYQHVLPASADSLMLQIRFAALAGNQDGIKRYGKQLARNFPQSQQYQQFLANEY